MIEFFKSLLKDKSGNYSLREFVSLLFVLVIIASWIAHQFFDKEVPEYMFYAFVSIVFAGCFGYSIERKDRHKDL
jgi:choline-glycine betaine transporter